MKAREIKHEDIIQHYRYSEQSPRCLERKIKNKWVFIKDKNIKGYYRTSFFGLRIYAHRNESKQRYEVYWSNNSFKKESKRFSLIKYDSKEECFIEAKKFRQQLVNDGLVILTERDI